MATKRKSSTRKRIQRTTVRSRSKPRAKTRKAPRYVYYFGDGHADGSGSMKPPLGGIVAKKTNNARFAWDSYRRFLQMYGDVVMGVQKRPGEDHEPFETVIEHMKDERYGKHDFPDVRLTAADLKELVIRFKALIKERTGKSFPQDPNEQLWGAMGAVFGSWMNDRAIVYRRLKPDHEF